MLLTLGLIPTKWELCLSKRLENEALNVMQRCKWKYFMPMGISLKKGG